LQKRNDILENIDLLGAVTESCGLTKKDPRTIPGLTLAYLGDCVYELIVRSMLVESGIMHVSELNKAAVSHVRAGAQAKLMQDIEPKLTEDESAVYHRGRNAKSASVPKNASVAEYRTATGFEALIGYLYLEGRFDRILELVIPGADK